jgi:hypothetical protein
MELDKGGAHVGCCCSLLRQFLRQLGHLQLRITTLFWKLLSDYEPSAKERSKQRGIKTRLLSVALRSIPHSSFLYLHSKATISHREWGFKDMRTVTNYQKVPVHDREDIYESGTALIFCIIGRCQCFQNIERLGLWTSMDREPVSAKVNLFHRTQMEAFIDYDGLEERSLLFTVYKPC